jgi:mannose/fructose-specific phosphotransferase system component IIA
MTTPVGATQIEIAKFRCYVVPSDGDQTYLVDLLNDENARQDLAGQATKITIELPSQFLDKADIFSGTVNNRLTNAFSQENRLKKMSNLLGDLPGSAMEDEISQHFMAVLNQIKKSEQATMEAF